MKNFGILKRFYDSAVVWSWALNVLRLAMGLLLLPLLIKLLTPADFGMFYVLLSLGAIVPILDFGFSANIGRNVSYAMSGATRLQAHGLPVGQRLPHPSQELLCKLLWTTQRLYRVIALCGLAVLGVIGSLIVQSRVYETASPTVTWVAWFITLIAAIADLYGGWWNVFLRGMDRVSLSTRLAVVGYAVRLLLASVLLAMDAGLLSLPIGSLIGSFLQRHLARYWCLKYLGSVMREKGAAADKSLLPILWPNSWRLGVQALSNYLSSNALILICSEVFGLVATATFGLSMQLVLIAQGMAAVWTGVKWPAIARLRAEGDLPRLRQVFWHASSLQLLTFLCLGGAMIALAEPLLKWGESGKQVLSSAWLILLALNAFFDLHYIGWGTLISMENRLPYLWPSVITNLFGLTLALILVNVTAWGLGALVLGPLCAGILFNYWYWPRSGAKTLGCTWWKFTLRRY